MFALWECVGKPNACSYKSFHTLKCLKQSFTYTDDDDDDDVGFSIKIIHMLEM